MYIYIYIYIYIYAIVDFSLYGISIYTKQPVGSPDSMDLPLEPLGETESIIAIHNSYY